ncbi:hypothetical protein PVAND_000633 [Polypedilum vanderplanki]|uniref:ZAD domain-containing protein n=1 Tax=Polypedilum vanderplanki TaxID=319348 RepID=A0A9J6BKR9_POLVA|nr:hypothetical protein PVAND_000633 [Polypedilum vanderplanki]
MGDRLSYNEFLKIFERQKLYSENKNKGIEQAQAMEATNEELIIDSEQVSSSTEESENEIEQKPEDLLIKLCRICGGSGCIDIFAPLSDKFLTIQRSRYAKMKNVQIAEMIDNIGGEEVRKNDGLPEFVCVHCLSYLQHAYNIRLTIRHTSANLREIRKIANEESIQVEVNHSRNVISLNQQEINTQKDEIEDDKYWHETFEKKNAKVKITTKAVKEKPNLMEYKCPACMRTSYSIKTHNQHLKVCLVAVLERFFSELKSLYTHRFQRKITEHEYIIYAISLLFNSQKRINEIAVKNDINIETVTKQLPPDEFLILRDPTPSLVSSSSSSQLQPSSSNTYMQQQRLQYNNNSNRFTSPDYGYSSNTH